MATKQTWELDSSEAELLRLAISPILARFGADAQDPELRVVSKGGVVEVSAVETEGPVISERLVPALRVLRLESALCTVRSKLIEAGAMKKGSTAPINDAFSAATAALRWLERQRAEGSVPAAEEGDDGN